MASKPATGRSVVAASAIGAPAQRDAPGAGRGVETGEKHSLERRGERRGARSSALAPGDGRKLDEPRDLKERLTKQHKAAVLQLTPILVL